MIITHTVLGLAGFVFSGFALSRLLRRNDIADVLWGLGFVGLAVLHAFENQPLSVSAKLVLGLIVFWGLRLSFYIGRRMSKHPEDQRYANWRREWGQAEPLRAFFQVFLLQGLIMGVISLPVIWVLRSESTFVSPFDFLGLCLVIIGLCFEGVSDFEMAVFKSKSENRGKIMNQGLWAYSRHPNYFGEILIWWGFFFFALNLKLGLVTLVSPVLLTFLLLRVSGVTMLEKVLAKKGAAFLAYTQATPALLPFRGRAFLVFGAIFATLVTLDALWLGGVMKEFYSERLHYLARMQGEEWDPVLWAAGGVYLAIALGVQVFATQAGQSRLTAVFKGALFGLSVYAVYEFTNISLVKEWPLEMALVDILWGVILCGSAAFIGQLASSHQQPKS